VIGWEGTDDIDGVAVLHDECDIDVVDRSARVLPRYPEPEPDPEPEPILDVTTATLSPTKLERLRCRSRCLSRSYCRDCICDCVGDILPTGIPVSSSLVRALELVVSKEEMDEESPLVKPGIEGEKDGMPAIVLPFFFWFFSLQLFTPIASASTSTSASASRENYLWTLIQDNRVFTIDLFCQRNLKTNQSLSVRDKRIWRRRAGAQAQAPIYSARPMGAENQNRWTSENSSSSSSDGLD